MDNSDFKCISCNKNYTTKYYLKKHIENCKLTKIQLFNNEKLNDKEQYEKKLEDLKLELETIITRIDYKNSIKIIEIERKNEKKIAEIELNNYIRINELKDTIVNKDIIISELNNEIKDNKIVLIKYLTTKKSDINKYLSIL